MIILPRQARDKHGESTQKQMPFSRSRMTFADASSGQNTPLMLVLQFPSSGELDSGATGGEKVLNVVYPEAAVARTEHDGAAGETGTASAPRRLCRLAGGRLRGLFDESAPREDSARSLWSFWAGAWSSPLLLLLRWQCDVVTQDQGIRKC